MGKPLYSMRDETFVCAETLLRNRGLTKENLLCLNSEHPGKYTAMHATTASLHSPPPTPNQHMQPYDT
jgi:hypothetical protein